MFKCFTTCISHQSAEDTANFVARGSKASKRIQVVEIPEFSMEALQQKLKLSSFNEIGQGSYGSVYLAKAANETKYAVKLQTAKHFAKATAISMVNEEWRKEIALLQEMSGHANFLKLKKAVYFRSESNKKIEHMAIQMEYLPMSLADIIEDRPEAYQAPQLRVLLSDHLNGLRYLHRKHIIHHDIKPANSLVAIRFDRKQLQVSPVSILEAELSKARYKIIDFGISERLPSESSAQTSYRGGTRYYMAREKANREEKSYDGTLSDAYSLGCLMAEAIPELRSRRRNCRPSDDNLDYLQGTNILDIVYGLLKPDATQRLNIERALSMLKQS